MNFLKTFLEQYGMTLLYAVLTAIAGYFGTQMKRILEKYVTDRTKRSIVEGCVKAVEQLYNGMQGEEKKQKAIESISAMLSEKNISISPPEMEMLIESVVAEFNTKFKTE